MFKYKRKKIIAESKFHRDLGSTYRLLSFIHPEGSDLRNEMVNEAIEQYKQADSILDQLKGK